MATYERVFESSHKRGRRGIFPKPVDAQFCRHSFSNQKPADRKIGSERARFQIHREFSRGLLEFSHGASGLTERMNSAAISAMSV